MYIRPLVNHVKQLITTFKVYRVCCVCFEKLGSELESVEKDLARALRKYRKVGSNRILLEKTEKIQSHIETLKLQPNQQGAIKGMVLCQLLNELNGEINDR